MPVAKHAAILPLHLRRRAVLLRLCVALVVFLLQVDNKRSVDEGEAHINGSVLSNGRRAVLTCAAIL